MTRLVTVIDWKPTVIPVYDPRTEPAIAPGGTPISVVGRLVSTRRPAAHRASKVTDRPYLGQVWLYLDQGDPPGLGSGPTPTPVVQIGGDGRRRRAKRGFDDVAASDE